MISRIYPILRHCHCLAKPVAPRLGYKVLLCRNPEVISHLKNRNMSSDDVLNDPRRHLDYTQLREKMKEGKAVIFDVREHSEIKETGKLPGSIHIPLGEIDKALSDLSDSEFQQRYGVAKPKRDSEIIFSCRSGIRSMKALRKAILLGYDKASHYKGGWLDWMKNTMKN
ncbi:UNVERIFIED_CONTAM: hypothetical protein PYX00_003197 [Menopon gallinae]|uniref:Rhodanese domain-containing protein n=1 Tax=Menopon gallinae TaxID=328185 RepID=A0AAW2HZD8_9NEOP